MVLLIHIFFYFLLGFLFFFVFFVFFCFFCYFFSLIDTHLSKPADFLRLLDERLLVAMLIEVLQI